LLSVKNLFLRKKPLAISHSILPALTPLPSTLAR
jgi:hypothetical protein